MTDLARLQLATLPLLQWFGEHRRDLPWRKERTPYTVLVSELMLQQTRVEAVKERYTEFLRRFPTVEALAAADEEAVLKAWEGLGYYSRARNLHKAAKIIAREGFPQTWVGVRALPGVGDYTAGAISSIALGLKTPAVDGNVVRIMTRLLADPAKAGDSGAKKRFSELLAAVYPEEAGEFTEALMELGAIVCVPNGPPMCGACPWSTLCKANLEGRETEFPQREEPKKRRVVYLNVYVLKAGEKFALVKREEGLLGGLYGFPAEETEEGAPGRTFGSLLAVKRAKHIFTHIEWRMTGYLFAVPKELEGYLWATREEIGEKYALPSAFRAFRKWTE